MRIDPDPGGSELQLLGQYLDYERETVLLKSDGLSGEQFVQKLQPSDLTLGGLLYHLALVEEYWMEVRFLGRPERDPWVGVDWDTDPNWEFRTAADFSTLAWTFSDPGRQMELDARRIGEFIVLAGSSAGKKVEKKLPGAGATWNQLFQIGMGPIVLSGKAELKFCSIGTEGPGELKMGKFTATRENEEKILLGGKEIAAVHLRVSLSGLLSIFWHGDYWYRQSDGRFLRFRGKNRPGGPEAVLELVGENAHDGN